MLMSEEIPEIPEIEPDCVLSHFIEAKEYHVGIQFLIEGLDSGAEMSGSQLEKFLAIVSLFKIRGQLTVLCGLFKHANRDQLLRHPLDASGILALDLVQQNSLLRKLACKLSQRISLCYLPPRSASWRYSKMSRSLFDAFDAGHGLTVQSKDAGVVTDMSLEVPDVVEESLQILLDGLRDSDTIVRWVCAKGIARLSNRLPFELADEILSSVLGMLQEDVEPCENTMDADISSAMDTTWHGCCSCLAEMARRGLLLPAKLDVAVPWILKALLFDQKKGAHSIGAHVRDSAAYVCWSFARAYESEVLAPFSKILSQTMIKAALTDREVNVRRACAAAFQEHVGRHGLFDHGLEVVGIADYFALGNRDHVFLQVLPEVAKYETYGGPLLQHLATVSLYHWDLQMRQLAAKSIRMVLNIQGMELISHFIPHMLQNTHSSDLTIRTGAIYGLAQVFLSQSEGIPSKASSELFETVCNVVSSQSGSALESFGSDLTRMACCDLVSSLCKNSWLSHSIEKQSHLNHWWSFIQACLARPEDRVQELAGIALVSLASVPDFFTDEIHMKWVLDSLDPKKDKYARRSVALAIGNLDLSLLERNVGSLVNVYSIAVRLTSVEAHNDVESRRNAVTDECFFKLIDSLKIGIDDYSVDSRGDVGSWVREASIKAFATVFSLFKKLQVVDGDILTRKERTTIVSLIARQAVEKIDRLRSVAGLALLDIIANPYSLFEHQESLAVIFNTKEMEWTDGSVVFPVMVKLLKFQEFHSQVLLGFITTIGGLSENVVKPAMNSFKKLCQKLPLTVKNGPCLTSDTILQSVVDLFKTYQKKDRVTVSLLDFVDQQFNVGLFGSESNQIALTGLFECLKSEVVRTKSMKKIMTGCNLFFAFANLDRLPGIEKMKRESLEQLVKFLCHPYPIVRRYASDLIYLVVTTESLEFDPESAFEETLISTTWDVLPSAEAKKLSQEMVKQLIGF